MEIKSTIKFKSYNNNDLIKIINLLSQYADALNLTSTTVSKKKKKKRFTLLSSPHVHKKARDQYELVTYTHFFKTSGSQSNTKLLLNNLRKNINKDINYYILFEKNFK